MLSEEQLETEQATVLVMTSLFADTPRIQLFLHEHHNKLQCPEPSVEVKLEIAILQIQCLPKSTHPIGSQVRASPVQRELGGKPWSGLVVASLTEFQTIINRGALMTAGGQVAPTP